jgi:hypothetical protein
MSRSTPTWKTSIMVRNTELRLASDIPTLSCDAGTRAFSEASAPLFQENGSGHMTVIQAYVKRPISLLFSYRHYMFRERAVVIRLYYTKWLKLVEI